MRDGCPAAGQAAAEGPALLRQAHPKLLIPLDVVCWALLSLISSPSSDDLTSLSVDSLTPSFPASSPAQLTSEKLAWEGFGKGHGLGGCPGAGWEKQGGSVLGIQGWGWLLLIQPWITSKFLKHLWTTISAFPKQCLQSTLRLLGETLDGCKILAISY